MSMELGYALSSFIFIGIFVVAVIAQIFAKAFHPLLYWLVVVATTTAGTTMADFADRSLGIGYPGGASLLFLLLMASLIVWYWSAGSISVNTIVSPKVETFYWVSILFSQTLGTALGDWMADTNGLGYEGGALVFSAGLAVIAAAYFWTGISRTLLFWAAFILTRPLGATLGDLLDKPLEDGGLAFSRLLCNGHSRRASSSPVSRSCLSAPAPMQESRMRRVPERSKRPDGSRSAQAGVDLVQRRGAGAELFGVERVERVVHGVEMGVQVFRVRIDIEQAGDDLALGGVLLQE